MFRPCARVQGVAFAHDRELLKREPEATAFYPFESPF
jgi:hypothetical protein